MTSLKKDYNIKDFKKYKNESNGAEQSNEFECRISNVKKIKIPATLTNGGSDSNSVDDLVEFNNEDRKIAQLYRKVVDRMMVVEKLKESTVDYAIAKLKEELHRGHKQGFRRHLGIDFCDASNICGYLRRYATCHIGLVKKLIWNFFSQSDFLSQAAKMEILGCKTLKVVSLGGGPGNDLVGFCTALQEATNSTKRLDLKIIDISQGWVSVFSSILKQARNSNSGSLSKLLKKTVISTGFVQADLNADDIIQNETVSSVIREADVVLMVKLVSLISDMEADDIIKYVAKSMSSRSKLIFIETFYGKEEFHKIPSLEHIYGRHIKYKLSFKPSKYKCASIDSSRASIAIYQKEFVSQGDSTSGED